MRVKLSLALAIVLLGLAFSWRAWNACPTPILHPTLREVFANNFQSVVSRAPLTVTLTLENAGLCTSEWESAGGSGVAISPQTYQVIFDQAGVYSPSVTLRFLGLPRAHLTRRVVVLSEQPAVSLPGRYGVNQDLAWDPPASVEPQLAMLQTAGVQWVRLPLRWVMLEHERGEYWWETTDRVIAAVNQHDLKVLAVLGGTPLWASGVDPALVPAGIPLDAYAPQHPADFAEYVYYLTKHYAGQIQAYEVLNEPNSLNHWRPQPDAEQFATLLCAGYRAIKYVDPQKVVVMGGLNGNGLFLGWEPPTGRDFLKKIYAGEGRHCFDVVALHPFAHPTQDGVDTLQRWLDAAREFLDAHNDPREIWLTEAGWSSGEQLWGHTTITEDEQAAWVTTVYQEVHGPTKIFWYNFREGQRTSSDPEQHWGWVRYDLSPKPAYAAFLALPK